MHVFNQIRCVVAGLLIGGLFLSSWFVVFGGAVSAPTNWLKYHDDVVLFRHAPDWIVRKVDRGHNFAAYQLVSASNNQSVLDFDVGNAPDLRLLDARSGEVEHVWLGRHYARRLSIPNADGTLSGEGVSRLWWWDQEPQFLHFSYHMVTQTDADTAELVLATIDSP